MNYLISCWDHYTLKAPQPASPDHEATIEIVVVPNNDINVVAMEKIRSFGEEIEKAKPFHFFPKGDETLQLCYLATVDGTPAKCPFTKGQLETFENSKQIDYVTQFWLRWAVVPFVGMSAFSYVSFIALSKLAIASQATISGSIGAFQGFTFSMIGLVVTGTNPHHSSVAANNRQDRIHEAKEKYEELALALIDLYEENRDLAKDIADHISIPKLRLAIRNSVEGHKVDEMITKSLNEVVQYIQNGTIPKKRTLRGYIDQSKV